GTATPTAWGIVKATLNCVNEQAQAAVARAPISLWASAFDRAAISCDDAGAALYALGRSDLLDAASNEVVETLHRWQLLQHAHAILEIGCGTGRFVERLAAMGHLVAGIDISYRMLQRARSRCRSRELAYLIQTTGCDLSALADGSFDLVLAIDVFPYLVMQDGDLAQVHVRDVARVLKPGGRFLILNYSYRHDDEIDATDVAQMAARNG